MSGLLKRMLERPMFTIFSLGGATMLVISAVAWHDKSMVMAVGCLIAAVLQTAIFVTVLTEANNDE